MRGASSLLALLLLAVARSFLPSTPPLAHLRLSSGAKFDHANRQRTDEHTRTHWAELEWRSTAADGGLGHQQDEAA